MGELGAEIVRQIVEGADVILGAFIGAGSASIAAYLADSRRFKRVDKYRDYADRRQAYLEFVASWHSYEEAKTRTPPDQQACEEADLEFQSSFNALSLIAPDEVRAAADDVGKEKSGAPGRFWKAVRNDLGKWPSGCRRMVGS